MQNIYMRFPGGKKKALTLSYDDGVKQDIRLIQIMQKHGLFIFVNKSAFCLIMSPVLWYYYS